MPLRRTKEKLCSGADEPPPPKPRVAQCHFPRMPGDFGAHMLHLCYHLFGEQAERNCRRGARSVPSVTGRLTAAPREAFAQVPWEAQGAGGIRCAGEALPLSRPSWLGGDSSVLRISDALRPPEGSDPDKWPRPQLLLAGLGEMSGGITEGGREDRRTDGHGEGDPSLSRHPGL